MEALGSTLGIQVSSGTNITRRKYGPLTLRAPSRNMVSSCYIPHWELSLGQSCFASKLALHVTGRSKRDFECRSSIQEDKSFVETESGSETPLRRKKLAVFVSGGGSNFRAIHEATVEGSIYGDVTVLVTDKPRCGGAEYARDNEIPVILFPKGKSTSEGLSSDDLVSALRQYISPRKVKGNCCCGGFWLRPERSADHRKPAKEVLSRGLAPDEDLPMLKSELTQR